MNLILKRLEYRADGIFSEVLDSGMSRFCVALEHAYAINGHGFSPKIPNGSYLCVRGIHQLEHGRPFETFEVTGVLGHTGILWHVGNFNGDSDGCILIGRDLVTGSEDGIQMVSMSRDTFEAFMQMQVGLQSFQLIVTG